MIFCKCKRHLDKLGEDPPREEDEQTLFLARRNDHRYTKAEEAHGVGNNQKNGDDDGDRMKDGEQVVGQDNCSIGVTEEVLHAKLVASVVVMRKMNRSI